MQPRAPPGYSHVVLTSQCDWTSAKIEDRRWPPDAPADLPVDAPPDLLADFYPQPPEWIRIEEREERRSVQDAGEPGERRCRAVRELSVIDWPRA